MTVCLGPHKSGKSLLMKSLRGDKIDIATITFPTEHVEEYCVKSNDGNFDTVIRELGGHMAPKWIDNLNNVYKIMYVIDASNLCQISAAGVLFYTLLVEPKLKNSKFALILTKMDWSYRQMRNEALLMLQLTRLQKEIHQPIAVFEVSALTGVGVDKIKEWIFDPDTLARAKKHG